MLVTRPCFFREYEKTWLTKFLAYPIIIIRVEKVENNMKKMWWKIVLALPRVFVIHLLQQARQGQPEGASNEYRPLEPQ